ncbi:MAG: endonuclease [bacterium]|nr:endonuclease [bacterium]
MKTYCLALIMALGMSAAFAQIPSGYYDPAQGLSGDQLKAALHTIIDGHVEFPYSSSSTDTWDILKETDRDPNNPNNVIGLYSRFSMNGAAEYDGGAGWSREHVWAKSRGDFGTSLGAGTDLHHIRAEDVSTNSARNNRNFDECTEPYTDNGGNYSGATPAFTSSTDWVWEPPAEVKGDVARMLFYMVVRYEGTNGDPDLELQETYLSNTSKDPFHAKLSTLIQWHLADPVDDAERNRNDVIYSYQQNRNPFIDHPEYVCEIYPAQCGGTPGNQAPVFTSSAPTSVIEGQAYNYNVSTSDSDGDAMTITATTLPSWLSFTDNGNGTATLSGTASTANIGSNPVTLTVTDGIVTTPTSQSFTISVNAVGGGGGSSELFFSEYIEGSSYNKGLEIANFTGASVNLSGYSVFKQTNGAGSWGSELALSGSIADGDVYVIVNSSASATMQAEADLVTGSGATTFNGNDPVALFKDGVLIDVIGTFNNTSNYAQNVTLVRNSDFAGNTTYTAAEWTSYAQDEFSYLGSHTFNGGPTNQDPTFTSSPVLTAEEGQAYSYSIAANDPDGDALTITASVLPSWLTLTDNGNGTATLSGTPNNSNVGSNAVTVSVTDGTASADQSFAIDVTEAPITGPFLFFSEYIEGSSFNKGLEIANTTGSAVSLSGYSIFKQSNGAGSWGSELALSGTIADGDVYVVVNSSADAAMQAVADLITGSQATTFNGNDAVALFKDGVLVDVVGNFNDASNFAQDVTLVRNEGFEGNTSYTASEWTVYSQDEFSYLGSYGSTPVNQDPAFTSTPILTATEGVSYNYNVTTSDPDGDALTISGSVPTWLNLTDNGNGTASLSGTPSQSNIGSHAITISVTDGIITSPIEQSFTVTVEAAPCDIPTGLTVSNITSNSTDLSWTSTGAASYGLRYREQGASTWVAINTANTSETISGLTASTTYEAQVRAQCGSSNSNYTSSANFITDAAPASQVLSQHYFESGWDGWIDGGSDCFRYSGSRSWEGSYSIRLRDNSGTGSAMTSSSYDLSGWDRVEVEFYFYSYSMENGEDFWVRYFDGSSWNTVETYARGTDFENNSFYVATVEISSASYNMASNAQFRFQCDASGNADHIYIDEVTITGFNGASARSERGGIELVGTLDSEVEELSEISDITLYPMPVTNQLNISMNTDSEVIHVYLFTMEGKLIIDQDLLLKENNQIDVSSLQSGMYLYQVIDGDVKFNGKLIKD